MDHDKGDAQDKGDNEIIPGAVDRFPDICLTAEKKPRKTPARRQSNEGFAASYRIKWGQLPPNEVDSSRSTSGMEKEVKRERPRD